MKSLSTNSISISKMELEEELEDMVTRALEEEQKNTNHSSTAGSSSSLGRIPAPSRVSDRAGQATGEVTVRTSAAPRPRKSSRGKRLRASNRQEIVETDELLEDTDG